MTPQDVANAKRDRMSKKRVAFPYGETWINNKATAEQTSSPYKFTAKEQDPETGYYSFKHRYYDPRLGQWISPDPALHEYLPYMNKTAKEDLHGGGVFNPVHLALYSYAVNNPLIFIDPDGLKIYNVVIEGGGPNVFGHNLTLHVDDKTGKVTYYEVTGLDTKNVYVYVRSKEQFQKHYSDRLGKLFKDKNFDATKSGDGYEVVEAKGVNEEKVLTHLKKLAEKHGEGKEKYKYHYKNNNCAKFSYDAYKQGDKEYTPEPGNMGENPTRYPTDLNQAIEYHNSLPDTKEK